MAEGHARRPRLLKRSRWRSRCSRLVGIALGCGIGLDVVAWAAPPLGAAAMVADGASSSANADAPLSSGVHAPVSANVAAPAGPIVGCAHKGVTLQVLGSGGPELQDKRASSSYLVWRAGVPRVLVDSGGGSALRFGESGATMSNLDVILLTHLHVDHTADLTALVKSSFFEDRHRKLPLFGPDGNQFFPSTTRFIQTLFASSDGAYVISATSSIRTRPTHISLRPTT